MDHAAEAEERFDHNRLRLHSMTPALRSIVERAFLKDQVRTETDLMALGWTLLIAELRMDLQLGRIGA